METKICDRTENSYIGGRNSKKESRIQEGGGSIKKVVFRLGKQVLGQANFLSDTEEEKEEEEEDEKLVMDISEEEETDIVT